MTWHRLTHKKTGEQQVVASLNGIDVDKWDALPLTGEPGEFHTIQEDGSRRLDGEARARTQKRARFEMMSKADLSEWIERLEGRIEALATRLSGIENKDSG